LLRGLGYLIVWLNCKQPIAAPAFAPSYYGMGRGKPLQTKEIKMTNVQTEMTDERMADLVEDRAASAKRDLAEELLENVITSLNDKIIRVRNLEYCSESQLNEIKRYIDDIAQGTRALSLTLDDI
jgi:hypothetical protein